ncbi:TonB-dependent receptor [Roseateles asaccharophilus]|uniref:Iron complex outermembrane receptor protein n=1 Tax=Roseateles asaccharophilus TaxID=582607 RepID=A0ABU2A9N1_9BURK|nr:TonB-dependent receptor [Roseateles asaccharophilus]MDR7333907.1 iron complex outermembrane receptor protein [Roseateles asaccharophilus]
MKVKQTPIAAAVSLTLLGASLAVQAQQAAAPAAQLDQVVITGIRASLESAATIKKNSTAVVDAVSAEDVGKLPDSDVGQALGRIPGISVGRAFGQGATVSIRGSDPQMTYTTLNGQTVASTGWYDQLDIDRSFNYSLLPSELIGGMEVYKSQQADLTEGGIGGTVIVKTRKPLDMAANSGFVGVKYGKGTISDAEKEVSGLFSWKNQAKTFGVLAAGAHSQGAYIRNGIEADNRWSGDIAPTAFIQDRKRDALNVTLQARPAEGLDLGLNLLRLKLVGDNSNSSDYIFQDPENSTNCTKRNTDVKSAWNPKGMCVYSSTTAANPLPTQFFQVWARAAEMTSDTATFDAHYRTGNAKYDLVAGVTKAEGGTKLTANYQAGNWDAGFSRPAWQGTIDATGKQIVISPTSNQSFTAANLPTQMGPQSWATSRAPNKDQEKYLQMDATFDLDWGTINSFKTGLRYADHTFEKRAFRPIWASTIATSATSGLFAGTAEAASWNIPRPNVDAMVAGTLKNITGWNEDRSAFSELNEKNTSAYGMFEFESGNMRGNFGLRFISTKVSSTGYKFDGTPLAAGDYAGNANWGRSHDVKTAKYNDVLPSVNFAFDLRKDLVLRAAAAQAITRPNFANMFGVSVSGYNDDRAGNETWTLGSVGLKPMKSSQVDLSLEYYYGKGNLLSATYFNKDVQNFITTNVALNQKIGLVDPLTKVDNWTVQSFVNAGGGRLQGLELQANHAFNNGFGVVANYTFTEGTAPAQSFADNLGIFTQSSKHNVNMVGYYETAAYFGRLAYNWRSKYIIRENAYWYGNRMHDSYGTLDASFGWNINKWLKLSFEAINLTKQDDVQYGVMSTSLPADGLHKDPLKAGYPAWSFKGETSYKIGLTAKF